MRPFSTNHIEKSNLFFDGKNRPPTDPRERLLNQFPTISSITNQTTNVDTATNAIFTVGDTETAAVGLTVSGSSSNKTLVPDANIVFGGSGGNRIVTVMPASGQSGSTTITVTVSDGAATTSTTFTVSVN